MTEPIMQIDTPLDSLVITGTNVANGYIYDNDSLDAWFRLAEVNVKLNKRPNAHGTFLPDQLFTNEARIPMSGTYFGTSPLDAALARKRLSALFADGRAIMLTVTDDLGPTSRVCFVIGFRPEWTPDAMFTWTLELASPDPRRYGTLKTPSTPLRSATSGLVWPLGTTPGKFWDWGTPGNSGRVVFQNNGNTTSFPAFLVGSGGTLSSGFAITEVATGRTITYPVSTAGNVVRLDSRTQRVTIGSSDVTGNATRLEWFAVPPGASYEYQFATLGATTGAPMLQLLAADAYL